MSIGSTQSSGGSLDSFIRQILALERQPAVKLEQAKSLLTRKLGVFTDISTRLTALKTSISGLKNPGGLSSLHRFSVTSSNSDVLTATANSDATAGSHVLQVSSLARGHALASGGFVATDTSFTAGTYTFDVTVAGVASTVAVTIEAGDTNEDALNRITSAINLSGAEVSASIVTSDAATGTKKIILSSVETGTANIIADISDTTGGLAAALGINGTSTTAAYSAATTLTAADAAFKLDGLDLSSSSNLVENVLAGVTIDLKGLETDIDVTLKVQADTEEGKEQVEDFITKYNEVITHLRSKLSTSDNFDDRGILAGETAFLTLVNDLRFGATRSVSGLESGALSRLSELGITSDREGKLKLSDAAQLETALSTSLNEVEDLFGSEDGVAARLDIILTNFTSTNGALDQEKELLNIRSDRLSDRIDRIDAQLESREKILRAQYGRLVELVTQLTGQQLDLGSVGQF